MVGAATFWAGLGVLGSVRASIWLFGLRRRRFGSGRPSTITVKSERESHSRPECRDPIFNLLTHVEFLVRFRRRLSMRSNVLLLYISSRQYYYSFSVAPRDSDFGFFSRFRVRLFFLSPRF
jgi:hypothetical protein